MKRTLTYLSLAALLTLAGCKDESNPSTVPSTDELEKAALANYANLVYANYSDAYDGAKVMSDKINAFLAAPSAAGLDAARQAWRDARVPYGQTEAFRFYGGPIDGDNGPESYINGWPLDESYIDYVKGSPTAGIINDPTTYPAITKQLLIDLNEKDSETHLSTGWHAIEFLLWGQDFNANGPGDRSYTDYTTATNATRRSEYLKAVTELLLDQLGEVRDAWQTDAAYRKEFTTTGDAKTMLSNMFRGIAALSKGELAGERLAVALASHDQEDEHSCFSDNTHVDIAMNFKGIQNVYMGTYTRTDGTVIKGTGLADIVAQVSAQKNQAVLDAFSSTQTSVDKIVANAPFDQEILTDAGGYIAATIDGLRTLSDRIVDAAFSLGIQVNGNTE